jgi:hypothetical protein
MPLFEKKDYRIFTSREGDWDVAAYNGCSPLMF